MGVKVGMGGGRCGELKRYGGDISFKYLSRADFKTFRLWYLRLFGSRGLSPITDWRGGSSRMPGAGIGSRRSLESIESDPIDFLTPLISQ